MLRRLHSIAALLSLIIGVLFILPWVRSYSTWQCFFVADNRQWFVVANDGEVGYGGYFRVRPPVFNSQVGPPPGPIAWIEYTQRTRWTFETRPVVRFSGGHTILNGFVEEKGRFDEVPPDFVEGVVIRIIPAWWVTASLMMVPVLWFLTTLIRRTRRRRAIRASLCPDCGYDLRASDDRCPECGRPIEKTIPDRRSAATLVAIAWIALYRASS